MCTFKISFTGWRHRSKVKVNKTLGSISNITKPKEQKRKFLYTYKDNHVILNKHSTIVYWCIVINDFSTKPFIDYKIGLP